jgi:hypothetical protein
MATSGQFSCPPLGSFYWPLTWEAASQSEDVADFEAGELLHSRLADLAQRFHESEG